MKTKELVPEYCQYIKKERAEHKKRRYEQANLSTEGGRTWCTFNKDIVQQQRTHNYDELCIYLAFLILRLSIARALFANDINHSRKLCIRRFRQTSKNNQFNHLKMTIRLQSAKINGKNQSHEK